jgi:hypothetical protein
MTFLTINAYNKIPDVICHRNLEITYLKDLEEEEEGGGARSRRLLLKFRVIVLSEFGCPIRPK